MKEKSTLTAIHDTILEIKNNLPASPRNLELLDTLNQCLRDRENYWACHDNELIMERTYLQDRLDDASHIINDIRNELRESINEISRLNSDLDAITSDSYRYRTIVDHFLHAENSNYDPTDNRVVVCLLYKHQED